VVWQANTSGKKCLLFLRTRATLHLQTETFRSVFRLAYVATCVLIQHKVSLSHFMFSPCIF